MVGLATVFGAGGGTSSYEEVENTDLILLWGSNARAAHPIFFHHVLRGLEKGARLVVVDPRRTESAAFADLWLGIDVGTDVALSNTIAREIIANDLHNRAFIELEETVKSATSSLEKSAAHLNLAIVHMRLANWDEALAELKETQLPDGAGVSAGTVAYLTGLCLDAQGRPTDAQAAFSKAAAATSARLGNDGPLVAVLAQQKLQRR